MKQKHIDRITTGIAIVVSVMVVTVIILLLALAIKALWSLL